MAQATPNHIDKSPAVRDFRSDTVTTPTRSMIEAMALATVGDDVYNEDKTTSDFESHVAELLGHDAGLFVPSGTMSNQLGIRTHLYQPPHSVLCDHRAHVRCYEAGGIATFSGAMVQPVVPSNGIYLTLEDIQEVAILNDDIHFAPTKLISLENTLGGSIMPLSEVRRIATWARSVGLKMHLDGARLWNAVAAGAGSLYDYGREFDSVSVCFSKGLGAPIGSVLVASVPFIAKAKHFRKAIGGGMRQTGAIASAARTALADQFPDRLLETHKKAKYIETALANMGVKTVLPVETSILFLDLKGAGLNSDWLVDEAKTQGIRLGGGGRIVIHHQIDDEAVTDLLHVFTTVLQKKADGELVLEGEGSKSKLEYGSMKSSA